MQQERSNATRQDSLPRVLHKYMALIITTCGHLWQNLDQFIFYLPQPQNMDGPLTCSTFTVLSLTENLILMKKFIWSSLKDMKNWTKNYVCKLLKSLYGLKQAGRKWYNTLCKALADIGFRQSEADPAVFYAHHNGNITILACHVDNCTITGN